MPKQLMRQVSALRSAGGCIDDSAPARRLSGGACPTSGGGRPRATTVLLICHTFHPSNEIGSRRTTALARSLAESGVRVVVVSAFGDQDLRAGSEIFPGVIAVPVARPRRRWLDLLVRLKRRLTAGAETDGAVPRTAAGEMPEATAARVTLPVRLRAAFFRLVYFIDEHKKWSWRAARTAIRAGREYRAALVLVSAPPHSTLLAGTWAARRLGIPSVLDMRDPWSDAVAAWHQDRRIELRVLRQLERWATRRAAAVTSTSASAAALLVERDPDLAGCIHVIRNGFDEEIAPPLSHTGYRLSMLYAGMLYAHRNPYPLLAALERLLHRPEVDPARVQLTLLGERAGEFSDAALGRWLQGKRCAAVVRILAREDAQGVAREVADATLLVNLAQQQRLHVPAKTFEQLASGREILLIGEEDCETARVTAGIAGVGRVDQSDSDSFDAALLELYRRHAVTGRPRVPPAAEVRRFSRALCNARFAAVLGAIVPLAASHAAPQPRLPLSGTASQIPDAV